MRQYTSAHEAFIGEVGGVGVDTFSERLNEHYADSKMMKELNGLAGVVDLGSVRSSQTNVESHGFRMGSALGVLVRFGFPAPYDDSYLQTHIRRNKVELLSSIPTEGQEALFNKFMLRKEIIERSEEANMRHERYLGALATILITNEHNALQHKGLLSGFGYTMWAVDTAEVDAFATADDIALIGDLIAPDEHSVDEELQRILEAGSPGSA